MNLASTATIVRLAFAFGILFFVGCGSGPNPEILPVSGVVTIDGKPLPNAEVRFVPMTEDLDGNFIASGITGKKGEFSLRLPGKEDVGCVVGLSKVTIDDQPLPDKVHAAYGSGNQALVKRYDASLKNRPIPTKYKLLRSTPLSYEVSDEQSEFNIEIKR